MAVLGFSVALGGCTSLIAKPADVNTEQPNVTLTGKIFHDGKNFYLITKGDSIQIDSRKVDLKQYLDTNATVVGQYSGNTLFVDKAN